jgi:hypothetical protein
MVGAAVVFACVAATSPSYAPFPLGRPRNWEDVPWLTAIMLFLAISTGTALVQAWRVLSGRFATAHDEDLAPPPPLLPRAATLAAAVLGVLVLAEGVLHLGPNTGYWRTGLPRFEADRSSADGYVFWLDGQPLPSDSAAFFSDYRFLTREDEDGPTHLILPARSVYAYLVVVSAPYIAPIAGVYGAFGAINLLSWWLGALAMFDLARRATKSWWGGMIAGCLTAAGLGFTFMAGGATSHAFAYGLVPVILWLAERLEVFRDTANWRNLLLHAVLTVGAALTYSLLPYYVGLVGLYYLGRAPLRRLVAWGALTLAVSQAWAAAVHALTSGAGTALSAGGRSGLAVIAALFMLATLAAALPARVAERAAAFALLVPMALLTALVVLRESRAGPTPEALLAALQLPAYNLTKLLQAGAGAAGSTMGPDTILRLAHAGLFDSHFPTAFPARFLPFAALGFLSVPARWRDWSAAQLASITVLAGVSMFAQAGVHPRLSFVVYPAVYVLSARGLLAFSSGVPPLLLFPFRSYDSARLLVRVVQVLVAIACVLVLAYPANASLLGDQFFDLRFHGLSP